MTHDELLMRLWEKRNAQCDNLDVHFALSAVVELHKPVLDTFLYGLELDPPEVTQRYECENCGVYYPCPTIQAIEKALP